MKGSVYRKRGKSWCFTFDLPRDEKGKRRQKTRGGFKTRREAERALSETLARVHDGAYIEPHKLTLAQYFETWFVRASIDLRPATADNYARVFDRYILRRLGGSALQALTPTRLNGLYADLMTGGGKDGRPIAANTCRQVHVLLHRVLASAVKEGLVVRNVATAAEPPRQQKPDALTVWSTDQIATFLLSVREHRQYALWRLLCVTGCRRGESLAATWEDIDLDAGRWEIWRSLGVVNGAPRFGPPKTGSGRRTVRFADDAETVAALRAHRSRQAQERLALGGAYRDQDLVFCQEDGSPLHPNVVTRTFLRLAEKAGLPRIRLHDVRHSSVVLMLRAGIPVKVVSERVGHASTSFTQDVYASVLPDMQEDASRRIAATLHGSMVRQPLDEDALAAEATVSPLPLTPPTSRGIDLEAAPGIEPGYRDLQSLA